MNTALTLIAVALALVVVWHGICSLNEMTWDTPHGSRVAVALITSGAFAHVMASIEGHVPDMHELLLLAGLALMARAQCRSGVCPCLGLPPRNSKQEIPQ